MGVVEKIVFPYRLPLQSQSRERTAIFFGTDFYNLPAGSNHELFIERTDEMLAFMRRHLPNTRLLYQPHPNETDEYTKLDLQGFTVGKKIIAEALLSENALNVVFALSACSGASLSAYQMGFNAAVAIDLLHGAVPEEVIVGYRSYFGSAPENFFLQSLDDLPVRRPVAEADETHAIRSIQNAIGSAKKLWVLIQSPSFMVQAALIVRYAREVNPNLEAGILKIGSRRWEVSPAFDTLESGFNETILVRDRRILYSARPLRLLEATFATFRIFRLPIRKGDAVVSFCYTMFEEDCLISYHKRKARMIGFIESRWYHFTFVDQGKNLPKSEFRTPRGAFAFAWFLEPLLGLYRTVTREYKDGRVINFFRYRAPLESVYDTAFVLMPDDHFGDAKVVTSAYTPLT